jgi:hypothetical protein
MRGIRVSIRATAEIGTRRFPSVVPTPSASGQEVEAEGNTTLATRLTAG